MQQKKIIALRRSCQFATDLHVEAIDHVTGGKAEPVKPWFRPVSVESIDLVRPFENKVAAEHGLDAAGKADFFPGGQVVGEGGIPVAGGEVLSVGREMHVKPGKARSIRQAAKNLHD